MVTTLAALRRRIAAQSRFGFLAAFLAFALVLAACGNGNDVAAPGDDEEPDPAPIDEPDEVDEWDELLAAAEEEGSLVLYTAFPGVDTLLAPAFREAFPTIDLTVHREQSVDLVPRIEAEIEAGGDGADVTFSSLSSWYADASERGLLMDLGELPEQDAWLGTDADRGDWLVSMVLPLVFAFNADRIEPFTDWNELLRDDLRGEFGTCEPHGEPIVLLFQFMEDNLGEDFMEAYAAQDPVIDISTVTLAQMVAAGEIQMSSCMVAGSAQQLIDEGAPIEITVPQPAFALPGAVAALEKTERPNASKLFIAWLMSADGQQALMESQGTAGAVIEGVPSSVVSFDDVTVYTPEAYTEEEMSALREKWNDLFFD